MSSTDYRNCSQSRWSVNKWCYFKRQLYTSIVYKRNDIPTSFVHQEHLVKSDVEVKNEIDGGNDLEFKENVLDIDDSDTDLSDSCDINPEGKNLDEVDFDSSDQIDYVFDHVNDISSYSLSDSEDSTDYVEDPVEFEITTYEKLIKQLLVSFARSVNTQTIAEEYRLEGTNMCYSLIPICRIML